MSDYDINSAYPRRSVHGVGFVRGVGHAFALMLCICLAAWSIAAFLVGDWRAWPLMSTAIVIALWVVFK